MQGLVQRIVVTKLTRHAFNARFVIFRMRCVDGIFHRLDGGLRAFLSKFYSGFKFLINISVNLRHSFLANYFISDQRSFHAGNRVTFHPLVKLFLRSWIPQIGPHGVLAPPIRHCFNKSRPLPSSSPLDSFLNDQVYFGYVVSIYRKTWHSICITTHGNLWHCCRCFVRSAQSILVIFTHKNQRQFPDCC